METLATYEVNKLSFQNFRMTLTLISKYFVESLIYYFSYKNEHLSVIVDFCR